MSKLPYNKERSSSISGSVARLLRYLRPYRWRVALAVIITFVNAPLMAAGPILTKAAIDLFLVPDPSHPPSAFALWLKHAAVAAGFGGSAQQGIFFVAVIFMAANAAAALTQYMQLVVMDAVGQNVIHDLRQDIFARLQKVPVDFYDRNAVGMLMTRLTSDVETISEVFNSNMVAMFASLAVALYVFFWMLKTDWRLGFLSLFMLLLMFLFTAGFRRWAGSIYRAALVQTSAVNTFLQEHITGMHLVQLFTREQEEMRAFEGVTADLWRALKGANFCNAIFYPAVEVLAAVAIALTVWYGGTQVLRNAISLGTLVAFIQLAWTFYDPITDASTKYGQLQSAMISAERVFSLLDEPIQTTLPSPPIRRETVQGRIEFRNVWFAYKGEDWILKDVSFVVEPGEKVALVGHTGAGKTTIANLLLRFYDIQRGQILLDDQDIRHIDLMELRSSFSVVLQEPAIFPGDVISNIRLGDQTISEDKVHRAASDVCMDTAVSSLRNGYRTQLQERGANLSVGQKQLISFARALAFDRQILVLDEATSSIDTETELLVRNAVKRLMHGRTSLVIAHRLSTIQSINKILVMHKGEIRERGDHHTLLARRGLYWQLHQLQFQLEDRQIDGGASTAEAMSETGLTSISVKV